MTHGLYLQSGVEYHGDEPGRHFNSLAQPEEVINKIIKEDHEKRMKGGIFPSRGGGLFMYETNAFSSLIQKRYLN